MHPFEIPPELNIQILSYLTLPTLSALHLVNHQWHTFIDSNQNTIYRNAAWIHGWVPEQETLFEDLNLEDENLRRRSCYSDRAMHGVRDWKGFCRRRVAIQNSWAGHAPSEILPSPRAATTPLPYNIRLRTPYRRVHRIKVDEKIGIVMATTQVGGLVVCDLETDDRLWELPTSYVRAYAHLEYGEGYMIFDRDDGNKEIWLRTQDIPSRSTLVTSFPDTRQQEMASRLSNSASNSACPRAEFTPYALLRMPEHTRAYRFVFPTLLIASTDRAYLWDVRTGELVQTLDGIQAVTPFAAQQAMEVVPHGDQENGFVSPDDASFSAESSGTSYHSDSSSDAVPLVSSSSASSAPTPTPQHMMFDSDADDIEEDIPDDDGDEIDLPQFLGLLRYVEVSERHVVLVGRYIIRVFSRKTGQVVMDLPATRRRYGSGRWEVASRKWVEAQHSVGGHDAEEGVNEKDEKAKQKEVDNDKGKGKARLDSYQQAKEEGRELVRMPLRFSFEEYKRSPRLLIDSFVAAHMSSDGRHLVALLGGSRLLIIPDFEDLCTPFSAPPRPPIVPRLSTSRTLTQNTSASLFRPTLTPRASATPTGTLTPTTSSGQTPMQNSNPTPPLYVLSPRALKERRRKMQRERDRGVFERTLDVQLGPPLGSSSIYLAFEGGRVGVITTNAVYIVSADSLNPSGLADLLPSASSPLQASSIPHLTVSRLPYFSNPSWLEGVSCLMMSDTGMYLNWNPSEMGREISVGEAGAAVEDGIGEMDDADEEDATMDVSDDDEQLRVIEDAGEEGGDEDEGVIHHESQDERDIWEEEYERDLEAFEENESDRYHLLPNGDMLVPHDARTLEPSEVSTVFTVNFAVGDE